MKIKDLERTVNVAWSPASQYPILLAAGTAANQLDASFSTNAALELYALNLADPGMDMELKGSVLSDNRFYKIVWGTSNDPGSGIIVGGCDGGLVQMYSASKLLAGEDCLISRQDKHNGPVQSLDFNPFQSNLLASGAADSEIYIWDLNNTSTPMTPGSKSQPYENVQSLSWNRQVQHILATTFHTRCVVWDLRKNEPIIKLTDTSSHIRWKHVSWHPEVATQLCLASEEDQAPVIQLWDLRFATSPLKVLDNHQRGVLSVAWCAQDSDLLISCGKDNRILCWNPNSNQPRGEVLSEVAHTLQWNFDVAWCPRNPALIAASSFDGHVSVYSLMGGKQQQVQTSNKIADSFPGMDGYIQAPVSQQAPPVSVDLAKAPKWLKKPVGASFGFGGKLITFENDKNAIAQMQQAQQQPGQVPPLINRTVNISQVITEPELIQKSNELEQAVQMGNFSEYCRLKADSSGTQHERYVWYFIKANFDPNPKSELLNLLGFQADEINAKLNQLLKKPTQDDVNHLTDQMASLNRCDGESNPDLSSDIGADLLGDDFNASSTFDAIAAENKVNAEAKDRPVTPFKIKIGDDTDGCIAQALLLGNIEAAVELCLESDRMADALIIAMTGGAELLARTQYRYLQQSKGYVSALISALVSEDWSTVINQCSIESWKEALAAAITYSSPEELPVLCERLGERLETEHNGNAKLLQDAQLCYICAGSFNKLVASWSADASSRSPQKLQELVELVTFMQKAIEQQGRNVEVTGNLADLLSQYAILLASQGSLNNALNYLGSSTDPSISELRDRLYCNLGHKPAYTTQQQQQRMSRQSIPGYTNQQQTQQFNQPQNTYNQGGYQKFNTGLPNAASNQQQPWQNQTSVAPVQPFAAQPPKPFTPTPSVPPTQPPRPTSVGSAHSSSGIGGRSKYVVDPSVKSNMPSYGGAMRTPYSTNAINNPMPMPTPMMPSNQMMNNPVAPPIPMIPTNPMPQSNPSGPPNLMMPPMGAQNPMMPPMGAQNPMMPPMGAQNPMMPQSPSASLPTKPFPTFSQSQPIPATTNPMQNTSIMTPKVPNQNFTSSPIQDQPGLQSSMPGAFPNPSVANMYNPGNVEVAQQAINAFQNVTAAPGWNDPPVVSKGNRPQPKPDIAGPQAPITHPLYGTAPEMAPVNNGYGEPPAGPYGQMAPPMQQQQMNRFPMANQQYQQQQQQQQQPPQQQAPPDPPKQKAPVPEEHMYLQTVFDELKNQCTCAANNPQTKRKLDDVGRKLETLYDMLRENKLSPNTLTGLHQMVQMVQIGDYTGGLALHTQLVSGPDFAQIASFMPGLKVLLQCALQLQVYLR